MNARGRPRIEHRGRFKSGQIRPADSGITRAQLHRLRQISTDPWLGSRVGQLLFLGELSQVEADCAWEIAAIYGRYEKAMGLKRTGASPAYEKGYGRDESDESDEALKRRLKAIRKYQFLIDEIAGLGMGVTILEAIQRTCVDDMSPEPLVLPRLKRALGTLAGALGVRPQRERRDKR